MEENLEQAHDARLYATSASFISPGMLIRRCAAAQTTLSFPV